jgi:hypothetical protein
MQPEEWFLITRNQLGWSEFFFRSPFRSSYFLGATISLAIQLVMVVVTIVAYWQHLEFLNTAFLFGAVFVTVCYWLLALSAHRELSFLLAFPESEKLELGSKLHKVLSAAAFLTNQGLLYVSMITLGYLVALFVCLRAH